MEKGSTNPPESLLLKFLPLAYHHSYFTLDFTSFSQWPCWGPCTFLQLGYFGLDRYY